MGKNENRRNTISSKASMKKRFANWLTSRWFFFIKSKSKKKFYRISGMRRSGNHAVINWILKQLDGATCYNNNMGPFHPPENTIIKKIILKGFSKFNLVVTLEDKNCEAAFLPYDELKFGKASAKFNILILRDPYNMFASRWVWKDEFGVLFREDKEHQAKILEQWKDHARTYKKWIAKQFPNDDELYIPVNYNRWFEDKAYRQQLANHLGIVFTDKGKEDVTNYGFGSSFDGTELHKKASNLKVLERWKGLSKEEGYRSLFNDEELKELAKDIFKMSEAESVLLDA